MNCRACRFVLPAEAVYCPECGVKQSDRAGAAARAPEDGAREGSPSPGREPEEPVEAAVRAQGGVRAAPSVLARPVADAPVSAGSPTTSPGRVRPAPSVEALLAQANLLRMRGQWAEAVERCTEALRADPHSAAAHSLLGDIYENQGRLDKASHWYQLALEQEPESIADKAKLARVRELQAVRRRTGDPRFSWAYLVAVAGVAFLFVAFVMAAIVARDRTRGVNTGLNNIPDPQFPPSAPPRIQPLDHTDEEEKLASHLIALLGSRFMTVVTVTLNPMEHSALVTARLTKTTIPPDPRTGESPRDQILRDGYRTAYLARGQQRDIRLVTVRALVRLKGSTGDGPAEEVWRGRIDATRIAVGDDRASVTEVRGVYDAQWWNPVAGF